MHGLVNRSIQCFVRDTCGEAAWSEIATRLGLENDGFEAMLSYEESLTQDLIAAATGVLNKPQEMLLEDVGTYLVSHPNSEAIRRLLRFGGETFVEFLYSLDDLPHRARLAVPDLTLPNVELLGGEDGLFDLQVSGPHREFAFVLVGVLRAMADDFGALVLLDHCEAGAACTSIRISLLDSEFSEGRSFTLARPFTVSLEARR